MLGTYSNTNLLARRGVEIQSDLVNICQWLIFPPPKTSSPMKRKMYYTFARKTTMTDRSRHVSLEKASLMPLRKMGTFVAVPRAGCMRRHVQHQSKSQRIFSRRWLLFGLIHEILGDSYRHEDLICTIEPNDGETSLVSSSGLVEILDKWYADIHAGFVNARHI